MSLIFLLYIVERKQSFAVSAITEHLRVETVSEGADDWSLVAAHICIPKSATTQESAAESDADSSDGEQQGKKPLCETAYFDQTTFNIEDEDEELTLRWTDDYALEIRQFDKDFLYIYITRNPPPEDEDPQPVFFQRHEIPDGAIIYIPLSEEESPRLALRGYMSLGETPVRSDAMVVREGQYEIRQDSWRQSKHVVATGELFPGDKITFEQETVPFWARLQKQAKAERSDKIVSRVFVSDLVPRVAGFNVVATTDPQFSSIYLTRVGGQPTRVPVSWGQRLTTDPLIAGIVTILGLMATVLALRNSFFPR